MIICSMLFCEEESNILQVTILPVEDIYLLAVTSACWTSVLFCELLNLNISMHILHTIFHKFPKVLLRRIWPIIKSFFRLWSFPLFLWLNCLTLGWYCWENCIHENFKLFYSTFGVSELCKKSLVGSCICWCK